MTKSETEPSAALLRPTTLKCSKLVRRSSSGRRSGGRIWAALVCGGNPVGAGWLVRLAGAEVAAGALVLPAGALVTAAEVEPWPGTVVAEVLADALWHAASASATTRRSERRFCGCIVSPIPVSNPRHCRPLLKTYRGLLGTGRQKAAGRIEKPAQLSRSEPVRPARWRGG